MGNKLSEFLVQRDIYGQPITVLYKGSEVFRTKLGALFSLATYVLVLMELITLVRGMFDGSHQHESSSHFSFARYSAGEFNLKHNKFDLSVVQHSPLTPDIGRYKATRMHGEAGHVAKYDLPLKKCSESKQESL